VLYRLSYLGTVHGKKSEALLQDRLRKIKLLAIHSLREPSKQAVAEREQANRR